MAFVIPRSSSGCMVEEEGEVDFEDELAFALEDLDYARKENKRKKALIETKMRAYKKIEKEIGSLKKDLENASLINFTAKYDETIQRNMKNSMFVGCL